MSSLCKVLPGRAPEAVPLRRVEGLWGKPSPSSWLSPPCPERDLRANTLRVELVSPLADRVRMRSVLNVPVMLPSCGETDGDYLSPIGPACSRTFCAGCPPFVRAVPGQWRALWFDLPLNRELTLPEYPLTLRVLNGQGALLAEHTLTVGWCPPSLRPSSSSIPSGSTATAWPTTTACRCSASGTGPSWKTFARGGRPRHQHDPHPLFTPPLDTGVGMERTTIQLVGVRCENGAYTFDFSQLERFRPCAKPAASAGSRCPTCSPNGARSALPKFWCGKTARCKKKFGWHTPAMGPEYRAFLAAFLPCLTCFFSGRGLADRVYFHISDEPELGHLASYRAAAEFVRPHLAGFKTLDALSDYEFYRTGCVERPVVSNDHIETFLEHGVQDLWTYYCMGQGKDVANRFIAMPSARSRILGVQLYLYRIQGFLHWG